LLRRSVERLLGLLPAEQIYVITGRKYIAAIADELPELPKENLFGEPCARDTANAVGLAAHLLARKDPEGTMGIFTADHIILPVDRFQETIARGFDAAEQHPDAVVTFGIKPTSPHTGYGYVQRGDQLSPGAYEVHQFKEKPDAATAKTYFESGEYYWNSGMFAWRIPTIIEEINRHQPQMGMELEAIAGVFDDASKSEALVEEFGRLPKISIDYAVLEKVEKVICVEMDCDWLDVGSWTSLAEVFEPDETGNTKAAPSVVTLDARNNIFVSESDHLIAAIGVEDLVIVHAEDATVICRREDAQRIKEMVEQVRGQTGERYM
jgi:mannose-1-phosphate guanylyltransferase